MSDKPVSFEKHLADERAYYLGKTEKIPGSDKTIKEARKEYEDGVDEENQRMAERRLKVMEGRDDQTFTTTVTGGVTVEVARPAPTIREPNLFGVNSEAPESTLRSREGLEKLLVSDLVTIALEDRSHVIPDGMHKKDIINIILGEASDAPVKESASTKKDGEAPKDGGFVSGAEPGQSTTNPVDTTGSTNVEAKPPTP